MTLNNNLYRIEHLDPEGMTAGVSLLPDSVIYKAHFPEKSITPGVCIVQMAVELFGTLRGREYSIREVVNAKFLIVMEPQATPDVHYEFSKITDGSDTGTVKLQAAARSIADNAVMAKLSLILQEQ